MNPANGMLAAAAALLSHRDAADLQTAEYDALDSRLFNILLSLAHETDLRGLEVWWGNGPCRGGRVIGTENSPEDGLLLVLNAAESDEEAVQTSRHPLWEVLSAGWLQKPGEIADGDGYKETIQALARQSLP